MDVILDLMLNEIMLVLEVYALLFLNSLTDWYPESFIFQRKSTNYFLPKKLNLNSTTHPHSPFPNIHTLSQTTNIQPQRLQIRRNINTQLQDILPKSWLEISQFLAGVCDILSDES